MNGVVPLAEHHVSLIAYNNYISVFSSCKALYISFNILQSKLHRTSASDLAVYGVTPPWEGRSKYFTKEIEAFALTLAREMPVKKRESRRGAEGAERKNFGSIYLTQTACSQRVERK
jgi:hypothetical protein